MTAVWIVLAVLGLSVVAFAVLGTVAYKATGGVRRG